MTKSVNEWQNKFVENASRLVDEMVSDAKSFDKYGEATSFIKKVESNAGYGTCRDIKDSVAMQIAVAVCDGARHTIYEEVQNLPIKRGDSND